MLANAGQGAAAYRPHTASPGAAAELASSLRPLAAVAAVLATAYAYLSSLCVVRAHLLSLGLPLSLLA